MDIRLRHDELVRCLRRRGSATVAELADAVGVSRRTILRDIGALREQGFVIHSEPGRGGGVRLDPGSIQMTAKLTVTEIFALLVSVAVMRAAATMPFSDLADAGLARIERALPKDKVEDLRAILACLHVGPPATRERNGEIGLIDPALLPAFETGFLQRLPLRFRYTDMKGKVSERAVEPQAMLILPPVWYLVAYDPGRSDFRRFRMDRIERPEVVDGTRFRRRRVPFEDDICPFGEASGPSPLS